MTRLLLPALALACVCIAAGSAQAATTYYVAPSPTGSDSNPGTSGQPFATIQKAANVVSPGDTVIVRPGTYVGAKFSRSGSLAAPIVFMAQPGAVVTSPGALNSNNDNLWIRDASYITLSGFEVTTAGRAGIAVQAEPTAESHGVVLTNNYCHNNTRWGIFTAYAEGIVLTYNECSFSGIEHGIYVSNSSDNPLIQHNKVHDNNDSGIQINADPALDGDGIISNAEISYNVIYQNGVGGAAGINLASVIQSRIFNNLLYDNHSTGIAGWDDGFDPAFGTHDNTFYNNTVIQASDGRSVLSFLDGSFNNTVKNNILIHPGTKASISVDPGSESGLSSDYNVIIDRFEYNDTFITFSAWVARGHDAHSTISTAAAVCFDPTNHNYHPKSGGPAVDHGTTIATVTNDLDAKKRPQGTAYEIGSYEFRGDDTAGIYIATTGTWFLRNANSPGAASLAFSYGPANPAIVPLRGDWNGDGTDTVGIYDPQTGTFFLKNSNASGPADITFSFGAGNAGYIPIVGDWNGDGIDTVGLFEPVASFFFLRNSNASGAADVVFGFGASNSGWKPVVGDWNNDGVDTVGLYAAATGAFFLRNVNAAGPADLTFNYGPAGATAVTGDWNADGGDSIGVYVASTGAWFLRNSNSPGNADVLFNYGPANAAPIAGDWNSQ